MLTGTLKYHRKDENGTIITDKFTVKAVDISTTFMGKISTNSYRGIHLMAGEQDEDALWERRFNVGMSTVKVQTYIYKDEKGKNKKSPVNFDFFCKLGAIIRYIKTHCSKENMVGYMGLDDASGEYTPESIMSFNIPFECGEGYLGTMSLRLSEIYSIHFKTDEFELDLDTDPSVEDEIFYEIKNVSPKGFRLTEEYLGFPLKPVDINMDALRRASITGFYDSLDDIIANNPEKDYNWLLKNNYVIVTDDMLEEVCERIMNHKGYVYYDTETTGLNITFKSRLGADFGDQLVGVVLTINEGEAYFFPTQMKSIPNLCGGDHFYFMERYMRPILEGKELVAHNMAFDWKVAYIYDINANIVHDTMALYKLTVGAELKNFPIGLKELTRNFLFRDSLELSDLVVDDKWGISDVKFWDLPAELVRLYACADTDNTMGLLLNALRNDLLQKYNAKRIYEIEISFSFAVAYQEFYGHKIDIDNLEVLHEEIDKGLKENMEKMVEIVGYEFNPNSPPQLLRIMYTELGIPPQISRKTGRLTTDKDTLNYLNELEDINGNKMYPFVGYLLKYRTFEGVRKIIDKFPELATTDGYLFSKVMQYGTTTGRVSINTPNYQSYNDPIKRNIVPREGYYMFDTDYSSVEYRVLGNMAGNEMIKQGFVDPDFDYHAYQASRIYNVPYVAITKQLRKAAKGINFGLPYGMGDESLGIRVFGKKSEENTRKAADLRAKYFKGQEDIKDFFEVARTKGVQEGYTETYFGRRRYYHRSDFSVNAIRRQAGNQVIQGCLQGDTLIHTYDFGTVKIEDIVGYNLNVWDGEDWTRGDITYSGKKQKCIVKFKGGYEFVCSPIHKFLVRSNKGKERFVECKDLLSLEKTKNAHRVVVSHDYIPSEWKYVSDRSHEDWYGKAHNSNNVFLDDIEDSFVRGRVLGRLSSDGSVDFVRGRTTQFVAEHELDVYDYLVDAMSVLNCSADIKNLREGRSERVARVTVYSKTLAKEIEDLDIRHRIDKRIFADTEMLRGFLSGLFDGDGGISGKTITFIQGGQEDLEPFMKDIQKALLFFGIRSRYRKYDNRYVLQIKTTDNQRFLDVIGFINKDKQDKGRALQCKEDEHIFGRCLIVESVEITDEYIDMYDVCNTERGYYVADGVITHNTAADIYKLAVGRVFKRICKEGWLGKVLLSGFIHDELLGEVHKSIDPVKFLKVLREEFEVKISDKDGKPWCPLYMGFGWGMSWYEAKSVELPIKLQWELVDKYGETGHPTWDGDSREFCDNVPDMLREFAVRDIRRDLLDPSSQGEPIKPALNTQLMDLVKEDILMYEGAVKDSLLSLGYDDASDLQSALIDNMDNVVQLLDNKYHIQSLYKNEDGDYTLDTGLVQVKNNKRVAKKVGTQEAIDIFCLLHDTDRSQINILDIPDVSSDANSANNQYEASEIEMGYDEDEDVLARKEELIESRVKTLGMYLDVDEKTVYLQMIPIAKYMTFIKAHSNMNKEGYNIVFKDCIHGKTHMTQSYIKSADINIIQSMYLQYFKEQKQSALS